MASDPMAQARETIQRLEGKAMDYWEVLEDFQDLVRLHERILADCHAPAAEVEPEPGMVMSWGPHAATGTWRIMLNGKLVTSELKHEVRFRTRHWLAPLLERIEARISSYWRNA